MTLVPGRAAWALSLGAAFSLASCSGMGGGSLPATPSAPQSFHSAATAAVSIAAEPCTEPPVQSIEVTALTPSPIPQGSTATFTVCTQYFSTYVVSGYDPSIVSVAIGTSTVDDRGIKTATVTVDGLQAGSTSIIVTDKKGNAVTVPVTVMATTVSKSFAYTGAAQTFTVPTGVTAITVDAVGAAGGAAGQNSYIGGLGEDVKATLPVSAGEMLYLLVGGAGTSDYLLPPAANAGFNGGGGSNNSGGGGGASDVRTSPSDLSTRIIVAGGGGGAADRFATGGNAGFATGSAGAYASNAGAYGAYPSLAGQGGAQNAAGAGGTVPSDPNIYVSNPGSAGVLGVGGGGSTILGGGGGGGYYGGGAGASATTYALGALYGGGGGGSSFATSAATNISDNQAASNQCDMHDNGCITITW